MSYKTSFCIKLLLLFDLILSRPLLFASRTPTVFLFIDINFAFSVPCMYAGSELFDPQQAPILNDN